MIKLLQKLFGEKKPQVVSEPEEINRGLWEELLQLAKKGKLTGGTLVEYVRGEEYSIQNITGIRMGGAFMNSPRCRGQRRKPDARAGESDYEFIKFLGAVPVSVSRGASKITYADGVYWVNCLIEPDSINIAIAPKGVEIPAKS